MLKNATAVILLFLALSASRALACSCVTVDTGGPNTKEKVVKEMLGRADHIFVAKVVGFEWRKGFFDSNERRDPEGWETKFIKLSVERWWKGSLPAEAFIASSEFKRASDDSGAWSSCEYHFKEGETYLVFADLVDGYLRTGDCMHNQPLTEAQNLNLLGPGNPPVKFTEQ